MIPSKEHSCQQYYWEQIQLFINYVSSEITWTLCRLNLKQYHPLCIVYISKLHRQLFNKLKKQGTEAITKPREVCLPALSYFCWLLPWLLLFVCFFNLFVLYLNLKYS